MKIFFFIFFSVVTISAAAQQQFTINGIIKDLPDGTEVTIHFDNPQNEAVAKTVSKNGKFDLTGTVAEPALYVLTFEGSKQSLGIFLEASTITVWAQKDSLMFGTVQGSVLHQAFSDFRKQFDPYFIRLQQIGSQMSNPTNANMQDSLYRIVTELASQLNTKADEYIEQNKQSAITPLLLYLLYRFFQQPDALYERFERLDDFSKNTYYGKMVADVVKQTRIGAIGTEAIDFSQADPDGKMITLSSFRGKYVLVDFWASWCGPCRMENPNLVAAYNRYKNKNFTVFGVSLDRSKEPWLQAIAQDGLQWKHVSDLKFWSNEAARLYRITAIPQNFLVNPEGKIIAKNLRGEELSTKLEEIFKANE